MVLLLFEFVQQMMMQNVPLLGRSRTNPGGQEAMKPRRIPIGGVPAGKVQQIEAMAA